MNAQYPTAYYKCGARVYNEQKNNLNNILLHIPNTYKKNQIIYNAI